MSISRMITGATRSTMLAVTVLVLACGTVAQPPAVAQTAMGFDEDLRFEVINATTGEAGIPDRLTVAYISARFDLVLDTRPTRSAFTAERVPVRDVGQYLITAWYQGVPYYKTIRGEQLTAGPVLLYIFDSVADQAGVKITGMNVMARRQQSILRLEILVKLDNGALPQVTVSGEPATFQVNLPGGAQEISASHNRGPEPTPVEVTRMGSRVGLAIPLTSGANQVQIEAMLPWSEGMTVDVGSDLAIEAWSLLTSPAWLEVDARGLETGFAEEVPGYSRFTGRPLAAGETFEFRLRSDVNHVAVAGDLFTGQDTVAADGGGGATAEDPGDEGGLSLPLLLGMVVVIIVLIGAAVRRKKS